MKKIWLFILWILVLVSNFSSASAIDPMNLPKFEHFVNDYSNVFTEEQRLELGMIAKNIETNSGYQIVTVLFPHREGHELFDIALKAFNENKIWNKERNDGLLLAYCNWGKENQNHGLIWTRMKDSWCSSKQNHRRNYQTRSQKRKFLWSRGKVLWEIIWVFRRTWKSKYRKQHWRTRHL